MFRIIVFCLAACGQIFAATQVRTEKGTVEGVPAADPAVTLFRGIPFAAPPIGDLRWRPPRPAASWTGIRKADHFSRSCMQAAPSSLGPWTEEYMDQNERSEDCLYLNVWTPGTEGKHPVLLWIHGGGFDQGSTSVALYDGQRLAKQGVVVVTINYRLGIFGFFTHPELTGESGVHSSGNYGLLDAIAALKWVQANIAAFGGDPARVTIGGQSAGAMAVHALTASPLAKGLFEQAIAQSGSSAGSRSRLLADSEKDGVRFMNVKGAKTLADLRAMPVYLLMAAAEGSQFRWGPIVDGWMLPDDVSTIFAEGKQNDVATLTGWCADEGSSDVKYGKRTQEEYEREVRRSPDANPAGFFGLPAAGNLADAFLKLYPATPERVSASQKESAREYNMMSTFVWATQRATNSKTPVYTYLWDRPLPGPKREVYGAFHSSELPYVFNSLIDVKRPWEQADYTIGEKTSTYWAAFIKTGNPNGSGLPDWPAFGREKAVTMELGDRFEARPISDPEKVMLLEKIVVNAERQR